MSIWDSKCVYGITAGWGLDARSPPPRLGPTLARGIYVYRRSVERARRRRIANGEISSRPKIDRRTNNASLGQRTLPRAKRALSHSVAARFRYEDKSGRPQKEWEWKMSALRGSVILRRACASLCAGWERRLTCRYRLWFLMIIIRSRAC